MIQWNPHSADEFAVSANDLRLFSISKLVSEPPPSTRLRSRHATARVCYCVAVSFIELCVKPRHWVCHLCLRCCVLALIISSGSHGTQRASIRVSCGSATFEAVSTEATQQHGSFTALRIDRAVADGSSWLVPLSCSAQGHRNSSTWWTPYQTPTRAL